MRSTINEQIASVILAGGEGTRLFPLTINHSKPAVSYGGRYKLIDIPISNSLNSGINQIFVLGQHLTTELEQHLYKTYQSNHLFNGMIDLLTPEKLSNGKKIKFEGTADAVRKSLKELLKLQAEYFLILSGDQLYNIDFKKMLDFAIEKDADLTIAALAVDEQDAPRLGILKVNEHSFITDFHEKPRSKEILSYLKLPSSFFKKWPIEKKPYLGSMGIYIFKRSCLERILNEDQRSDFGKHLIPSEIGKGKTAAFIYDGYWEDIGTIKSFFEANIALTTCNCKLKTYDETNPIFTRANHLPGTRITIASITDSIICEGSIIEAKEISCSMIGQRTQIKKGSIIRNSVLLGNSYYTAPAHQLNLLPEIFQIGENCLIEKTIIDEHVHMGNNVKLINSSNLKKFDGDGIYVRDGIIVVTAGTYIPSNFVF